MYTHKQLEDSYHLMIKNDLVDTKGKPSPRSIASTVVPKNWKPPVEVIERLKLYIK